MLHFFHATWYICTKPNAFPLPLCFFLLNLYLLPPKSQPRNPRPQQQTTSDNTHTTQRHCQTRPHRIQHQMMSILRLQRKEYTGCNRHRDDIVDQRPSKVEQHASEDGATEINQCDYGAQVGGNEDEFGRGDGNVRSRADCNAYICSS